MQQRREISAFAGRLILLADRTSPALPGIFASFEAKKEAADPMIRAPKGTCSAHGLTDMRRQPATPYFVPRK
jgi:hypothetical protein